MDPRRFKPGVFPTAFTVEQKRGFQRFVGTATRIPASKKVVAADPESADAHNYLGYAYRWTGKMDDSFKHYNIALKLSPNHRGAHEYIGMAYLKVHQPEKAKEHLARLEKICGKKCEEYDDLAKAIASYTPKK